MYSEPSDLGFRLLVCKLGQKGSLTAQYASDSLQPSLRAPFNPRKLHFPGSLTRWPLLGVASGRPGGKPEGGRGGNSPVLYSPSLLLASQQ